MRPFDTLNWHNFYDFEEIDSTNLEAELFIERGIPGGIVRARTQSAGRGRRGKTWISSSKENLYITFFHRLPESPNTVPMATALAVFNTVKHFIPDNDVAVKWPNDILVDGGKCSGVLCKIKEHAGRLFYIAGIGINIEQPDPNADYSWKPASLRSSGSDATRDQVTEMLINSFAKELEEEDGITDRFLSAVDWMKGRKAFMTEDLKTSFTSKIIDFPDNGQALLVAFEDGSRRKLSTVSILELI